MQISARERNVSYRKQTTSHRDEMQNYRKERRISINSDAFMNTKVKSGHQTQTERILRSNESNVKWK